MCGVEVVRNPPEGFEKSLGKNVFSGGVYVSTGSARLTNSRGEAGRNAEIRAILAEYVARFPDGTPPSRSTIGRHLAAALGGS